MNQLQMASVFGSCSIGDHMWDEDCREFVKESHNVGREVKTNVRYYFDATDKVYVNAGTSRVIASKYFALSQPRVGGMVNVRV